MQCGIIDKDRKPGSTDITINLDIKKISVEKNTWNLRSNETKQMDKNSHSQRED